MKRLKEDPDMGGLDPDRGLDEDKGREIDKLSEELFASRANKQLFTSHANNVSAEYILFTELFASCNDYNNNSKEEEERREGLFTSLVNIVGSPKSRRVCLYLFKYGAVTQRELVENIPTTWSTSSRTLNTLRICGIVEKRGRVGHPYRVQTDRGAGTMIWSLKYCDPQASIEAQRRYGEIVIKDRDGIKENEKGDLIKRVAEIKKEIIDFLAVKDTRETTVADIYPHFREHVVFDLFNKACFELNREGYKIWQ